MQHLLRCEGGLLRIQKTKWGWQNRTKDKLNWEKLNHRIANLNTKGGQQGEHAEDSQSNAEKRRERTQRMNTDDAMRNRGRHTL